MYKKFVFALIFCTSSTAFADLLQLSPNGYSGLGLLPSAQTLNRGSAVVTFDPTLPGASNTKGYNTQIGLGLYNNFELTGRLATNDLKCNMFKAGACPSNNIRDFSASLKWSLPLDWLKQNNAALAVGVTDVGGAASYFKSYYMVGSKTFGNFEVSLGQAQAKANNALLNGSFGALNYKPSDWASLSVQRIGSQSWANASVQAPLTIIGMTGWLSFNQRISQEPTTDKHWLGVGVSLPMDRVEKPALASGTQGPAQAGRTVARTAPGNLLETLRQHGFYNSKIGRRDNGTMVFELENTSYQWNILDGAGVSLGLIVGAYASSTKPQDFELILTARGIQQVLLKGEAQCVKQWLENGQVCSKLSIESLNQASRDLPDPSAQSNIAWQEGNSWSFRPEIIVSPTLINAIGTEYGAFDLDMGANINTVLPLWAGATLESNRVKPLGIGTRGFESTGVFYAARLKPATTRTLLHQLFSVPGLNSQARLSLGTAHTAWEGRQIETSTQSNNGRHKLGIMAGAFKTDTQQFNNEKSYQLVNYRYAHDDAQSTITELTQGKFWGGDKGFTIAQKFWHGDTALNIYIRRSRMSDTSPLVSFAGLQFSIPFTPRQNKSLEHLLIRGTSQWTYTLESRIFDKENRITGGYGEIPKMGESLTQTFNRDRNSTQYLENNLGRIKNAFVNLGAD